MSDQAYFNFINTLNAPSTKKIYVYCLTQFLKTLNVSESNKTMIVLNKFLQLPNQDKENIITAYLVQKKVSKQFKDVIFATLKHACDMNDVGLNWRKISKFTKSDTRTGNEIAGRDRPYTHEEIQQIISFADQRLRTCFLLLASTGIRIGALPILRIGDLQKIQDLYKVTVYSGEGKEQYTTFTTPEAAKEIDTYLDSRRRRGENITSDSYLIVKRPSAGTPRRANMKGKPFKGYSLRHLLQNCIEKSGIRERDHDNQYKRKQVPLLHGIRKWTTKQLVDSNVKAEIREMLLGHKIGLTGVYYRPTEKEMLNEYMKAIPLLTISDQERLRFKLEERITIERTQLESLKQDFEQFKKDIMKRRK